MRFAFPVMGLLAAITSASPLEGRASSNCQADYTAVLDLKRCQSYKPYCSSIAPVTPLTTTVTQTSTRKVTVKNPGTQTITGPTVTITAASTTTTLSTETINAGTATSTVVVSQICAPAPAHDKRAEAAAAQNFGACITSYESAWDPSERTAACECVQATPTSRSVVKTTVISTVTKFKATTTTTPPHYTTTPIETITPLPETTTFSETVTSTSTTTVLLASPTVIPDATAGYDDAWFTLDVPFPLSLYNFTSSQILVSINGWLSLSRDGGAFYSNRHLPASNAYLPDVTFAPYHTDLFIRNGYPPETLAYQISGQEPKRAITIEWSAHHFNNEARAHFLATLFEAVPGKAIFSFYNMPDSVSIPFTTGVQRYTTNESAEFAFNDHSKVFSGLELTFDPDTNAFTTGTLEPIVCSSS